MKFITGKTYTCRSVCDHNCVFGATITNRTAKTVTATFKGEEKTFRFGNHEGVEFFKPLGSYSMAPMIRAE